MAKGSPWMLNVIKDFHAHFFLNETIVLDLRIHWLLTNSIKLHLIESLKLGNCHSLAGYLAVYPYAYFPQKPTKPQPPYLVNTSWDAQRNRQWPPMALYVAASSLNGRSKYITGLIFANHFHD